MRPIAPNKTTLHFAVFLWRRASQEFGLRVRRELRTMFCYAEPAEPPVAAVAARGSTPPPNFHRQNQLKF
jgi:hypothetical protein